MDPSIEAVSNAPGDSLADKFAAANRRAQDSHANLAAKALALTAAVASEQSAFAAYVAAHEEATSDAQTAASIAIRLPGSPATVSVPASCSIDGDSFAPREVLRRMKVGDRDVSRQLVRLAELRQLHRNGQIAGGASLLAEQSAEVIDGLAPLVQLRPALIANATLYADAPDEVPAAE